MQDSATEHLARAIVAKITGGLMADIVALQIEVALLRAENERLKASSRKPTPGQHDGKPA